MARPFVTMRIEAVESPAWRHFADWIETYSFSDWLRKAEAARSAFGVRCVTSHVPEGEWLAQWRAGMDPASAVINQLAHE